MLSLSIQMDSWAHRLPASGKLVALAVVSITIFPIQNLWLLLVVNCVVACLYFSLGIPVARRGFELLKPLWWVMVILAVYHLITWRFEDGGRIILKMIALVSLANFVTMTTRMDDMMEIVLWLLSPLRRLGVNTNAIALAFILVIRFTPILFQRASEMSLSWRARSAKRTGWRVILPLCLVALDDAENVSQALRARGGIVNHSEG